jgi:flagella basal body P-ring formation protein FlgA
MKAMLTLRAIHRFAAAFALLCLCAAWALAPARAASEGEKEIDLNEPWRIRFLEAAIVQGDAVRLGEVAVPIGNMSPETWTELAKRELWPSPPEGKAMNMTRPKLQEAVMRSMKDLAPYTLFPGSMALQRGGVLIGKEAIQHMVQSELAPYLASLPGETALTDFRLPQYVFMAHAGQQLVLEPLKKVTPGRLSLRLLVREMDGSSKQKLTGSVFADCWAEVPSSTVILNRDDLLDHTKVTFKRTNLATLRGEPWDGRGGPWRVNRPIGVDQVIYKTDVAPIPTVRKGSIVTLLYEGPTVRLTTQAEALADGSAGETIALRNVQSRREVHGLIRDATTATITAVP